MMVRLMCVVVDATRIWCVALAGVDRSESRMTLNYGRKYVSDIRLLVKNQPEGILNRWFRLHVDK